jgi:hypothetical protein
MIIRAFKFVVRNGIRVGLFATALVTGGLLANALFSEPVTGSGKRATEERDIGNVTEVVIDRSNNLEIVHGDVPGLSVTADDNILPLLETRNRKGKLTFKTKSDFSLHPVTPISYKLQVPQLEKITITGVGNVQAKDLTGDALTLNLSGAGNAKLSNISCKSLTLVLSGTGNTTLTGKVDKLAIKLTGAGEVDAQELKAVTVDTHISGVGTAKIWAANELKAKISGAGHILYKGNPKIDQTITGAGSVKQIGG